MKNIITGVLLMSPIFVFASPADTLVNMVQTTVNLIIPLLLACAVLCFFWGLVKYISNASDESAKDEGKTLMMWGMIAIFVMVAFWGIIGFVQESLGLSGTINQGVAPTANVIPTI